MRTWAAVLLGVVALLAVSAVVADGRDNTGETVRAARWADDVCSATAAWEGQLEVIAEQITLRSPGGQRHDGGSGDSVEGTVYVRSVIERAIQATDDTLVQGIERAGTADAPQGEEASRILLDWAQETESGLRGVRRALRDEPFTTSAAFAGLAAAFASVEQSARAGREAFAEVAELDPALADALDGERACRTLLEEQA